MKPVVVVDTNVPIVANGESCVSPDCQERCVVQLLRVTSGEFRIAVDDGGLVIDEYRRNLQAGQPGVGHEFLRWLFNVYWDAEVCDQVAITPDGGLGGGREFLEFPDSKDLADFDRSDRKFVAVAAAHPKHPPIWEAADAKWVGWAPALAAAGIEVEFLCEAELRRKYEDNFAPESTGRPSRRNKDGA